MSYVKGYPTSKSLPRTVFDEAPLEIDATICIDDSEYRELIAKASALDIITSDIKSKIDSDYQYSPVDSDVVMAVTGMGTYLRRVNAERTAKATEGKANG